MCVRAHATKCTKDKARASQAPVHWFAFFPHSLGPRGGFVGQIGLSSLSSHSSDGDKESAELRRL